MDASAPAPPEPQALAEACARAMWAEDQASQRLGMRIERIAPGEAVLSMTVAERMVNGHGICHGGFIFTLADSAFAFACNTYNQRTVAQHCAVTFIAPARLGEVLSAQRSRSPAPGAPASTTSRVTGDGGAVVAEFRGHSRTIKGSLLGR